MSPSTHAAPPAFSADVTAFAAENGVADYLPAVMEMTRQLFRNAPSIAVLLEDDAEVADDRRIVFEIDVVGFDEEQLLAAQRRWTASLFDHCPATHVHLFVFALWASA